MGFEVDYIAVGEGERSGDAIALRYGNLYGPRYEQKVMVIDGGTKESGAKLVEHINTFFGTNKVDMVWCSHADGDHASGLTEVIEKMEVEQLLMHRPWNHAEEIRQWFQDGRITEQSLGIRIQKSLQAAYDLEQTALERGIEIMEPFAGASTDGGEILVLGPSRDYYQSLLLLYRGTPDPIKALADLLSKSIYSAKEAIRWVGESLDISTETLVDPVGANGTSAENNSSMILLLTLDGHKLLFTGDAGVEALSLAIAFAKTQGISLTDLRFLDVPHHGSKRNLGPTVLRDIRADTAFISAAANGEPKHPSKKVINALIRRGMNVYTTRGINIWHHQSAPLRGGYSGMNPQPFNFQVEE